MMTSFYNLLKYAATGIASPDMTYYDKARASTLMGGVVQTLTGIPPLSFPSDGSPLISLLMKGNTKQTGTPSPDSIIMPTFCGVRTANLWDPNSITTNQTGGRSYGVVLPAGVYTITNNTNTPIYRRDGYSATQATTFALPGETKTVRFNHELVAWTPAKQTQIMLNSGSTALPYEPYGYKIPITCAGQTTPVYLGQTQTVRRVKKLVLTGSEDWAKTSAPTGTHVYRLAVEGYLREKANVPFCTHFEGVAPVAGTALLADLKTAFLISASGNNYYYIRDDSIETLSDFKAYLAAQYQAGTPVTVWYVLAEPTTGIVNEPLCKIGEYADELHSTDAAVTIPTAKGTNTLTVDTTLQPSEMTIKYRG